MPVTKPIIQRFLKGLNTVADIFSQPEGIVHDLEELLFNNIGGLVTCDAFNYTGITVKPEGGIAATQPIIGMELCAIYTADVTTTPPIVVGTLPQFIYLVKDSGVAAPVPTGLIAFGANVGTGILLPGTTYTYDVTSIDNDANQPYGVAGETTVATVAQAPGVGNNAITLQWNIMPGVAGYRIYGRIAGALKLLKTIDATNNGSSGFSGKVTFVDDGTLVLGAQNPPVADTTSLSTAVCWSLPLPLSPSAKDHIPFSKISSQSGPVGTLFSGTDTFGFTPQGGIKGLVGPVPQMVMGPNLTLVLCLGNGIYPRYISPFELISGGPTAPLTPNNGPIAIAHGLFHAGIFWAANTWVSNHTNGLDGPSAIRQSNVNDVQTWNVLNSTFISKGDGTEITGLTAFSIAEAGIAPAGNVVVFKTYSTYVVTPLLISATGFNITQAQTDMGCAASRSIQYVAPFGIFRLTHKGIAVFDGLRDTLLTDSNIQTIFDNRDGSGQNIDWVYAYLSKAFYVNDPPMYCLLYPKIGGEGANGQMSGLLCYDLRTQAFTKANLLTDGLGPGGHYSTAITVRAPGCQPTTLFASSDNGKIYRWQDRTTVDANGNQVFWLLQTAEVFNQQAPSDPLYVKSITVKGSGAGSIEAVTLSINGGASRITLGSSQIPSQSYAAAGGDWEVEIEVDQTVMNINATISGHGPVNIHLIKWDVTPKETSKYVLA